MSAPAVTVVVCSHNGERTLPTALAHLERQTLSRERYEVIVVDDGSEDRTGELARSAGVRVVALERRSGIAAARNAGVRAATGAVIAFTDDDCAPAETWLAVLTASFSDESVDGVGGRVVPACSSGFLLRYLQARNPLAPLGPELLASERASYRLRMYLRGVLRSPPEPAAGAALYSGPSSNLALRREVIEELGGFDEAIRFGGEDEDLCRRAHARRGGAYLRYEPGAVVVHQFEPRLRDALRRARAYGVGNAQTAIKHNDRRPIVYPFPLLVALAALLALRTRRATPLALAALAPLAAYLRWPVSAWRTKSVEPLAYPYVQLAQEVATMLGEVEGRRAGYQRTADSGRRGTEPDRIAQPGTVAAPSA